MKSFVHFATRRKLLILLLFIIILAIIVYFAKKLNYLEGATAADKHAPTKAQCNAKGMVIWNKRCQDSKYCEQNGMTLDNLSCINPTADQCKSRGMILSNERCRPIPVPSTTSPEGSVDTCKQKYIDIRGNAFCPNLEVTCVNSLSSKLKKEPDYINMTYVNGVCSSK
jgi:hypothetical protein